MTGLLSSQSDEFFLNDRLCPKHLLKYLCAYTTDASIDHGLEFGTSDAGIFGALFSNSTDSRGGGFTNFGTTRPLGLSSLNSHFISSRNG